MSKENPKIVNVSIMVYRKFTRDFDSLGFRLGLSVEVRDGDARDSWYQGRLFLKERIKEEEEEIEKKFGLLKKQKEKGKIPSDIKGVGYEELQLENIPEGGSERVPIDVKGIIIISSKSVLVELFSGENKWIPKSCIEGNVNRMVKGVKTTLYVDVWLLEKEGIVY